MKPRIWLGEFSKLWVCRMLTGPDFVVGYGNTPREAYANWKAKQ